MSSRNTTLSFVICLLVACVSVAAQDATVTLANLFDARTDVAAFELRVERTSGRWEQWADATFRLVVFDATGTQVVLDPAAVSLTYVAGSSELTVVPYSATAMNGYTVQTAIANGMMTIAFHSPDSVGDAFRFTQAAVQHTLGRFELRALDGSDVSKDIRFEATEPRLHAHAFKMDHDSVTTVDGNRNVWYARHDNVEMATTFSTISPSSPCDTLIVTNFTAEYLGDLNVQLGFTAECELGTEGFIIERALVPRLNPTNLTFERLPHLTYGTNAALRACSVCVGARTFSGIEDDVVYRRTEYAYRIISVNQRTKLETIHDTVHVRIPNAIISNARILENPFKTVATVEFNTDDRLRLTAAIYDVGGRFIDYLRDERGNAIQDVEYQISTGRRATFTANAVASQGLYDVVLVGVPINDKTIEDLSRVVIKAQLLR